MKNIYGGAWLSDTGYRAIFGCLTDNLNERAVCCRRRDAHKEVSDMAEDRKGLKIKDDDLGQIQIADEVIAIIAGLAATEVEGVSSMAGNITKELVSKLGMKNLSKGVRIEMEDSSVTVQVAINIAYGYAIPAVSAKIQEKVKSAIENMTGLNVTGVNVRIADVDMKTEP